MRFLLACVMLGAALGYGRIAAAEQRVALVIGNSAYPAAPLKNPLNDARAVAKTLNQLGFDVLLKTNLSQKLMIEAVREFSARLKEGDVALFYYSGHGMQVRGKNFLIPIDADIRAEDEVPYLSFDVSQVLDKLEFARSRANIVILDACRNNPFIRTFRTARVGLAQMDAPGGTLIAFSTAPGSEARDGDAEYGTYTRHLIAQLPTPGLPVEVMFRRVREGVKAETKDRQIPWESSSLTGDFFFKTALVEKPAPVAPAPAPAPVIVQQVDPMTVELAFWDSIKASTNRADFEAYLEQYPNGRFAALAHNRLKAVQQEAVVAAAKTSPPAQPIVSAAPRPAENRSSPAPDPQPLQAPTPRAAAAGEQVAIAAPSSLPGLSASSRAPAIGDSWTYQLREIRFNKNLATITHEINGRDANSIQEILRIEDTARPAAQRDAFIEAGAGSPHSAVQRILSLEPRIYEHRLSGDVTLFEFAPFLTAFSELKPGAAWPKITGAISSDANIEWRFSGKVIGREGIRVAAGSFNAIKVELEGVLDVGGTYSNRNFPRDDPVINYQVYSAWFAPEVGRVVKYTRKTFNRTRYMQDHEDYELVRYNLK